MACGGSARYLLALIVYLGTIAALVDGKIFTSFKPKDNTVILRASSGPLRDQVNHLTARFRRDATAAKNNNNNTTTVTSRPTATTTDYHRQQQENINNNGKNNGNSDSNGPLESPDLLSPSVTSPTLITSFVNLPDWNHNEAIVHWSGNKSNVCTFLFIYIYIYTYPSSYMCEWFFLYMYVVFYKIFFFFSASTFFTWIVKIKPRFSLPHLSQHLAKKKKINK